MLYSRCGALRSVKAGAATFVRDADEATVPAVPENRLVTISTARTAQAAFARLQLCALSVEETCGARGLFEVTLARGRDVDFPQGESRKILSALSVLRVTLAHGTRFLCTEPGAGAGGAGGAVALSARPCVWDLLRAGESRHSRPRSEPCVWLRATEDTDGTDGAEDAEGDAGGVGTGEGPRPRPPQRGLYLAVSSAHSAHSARLALVPWRVLSNVSGCWAFGYEQAWIHHHFLGREDFRLGSPLIHPIHPIPRVWLMASAMYAQTLQRLLKSFEDAGEPVHIVVRWVPDLKDTKQTGFILTGSVPQALRVYFFNYLKLLFIFEALLDALLDESRMVIVMDLDVQVQRGQKTLPGTNADCGAIKLEIDKRKAHVFNFCFRGIACFQICSWLLKF